MFDHNLTVVNTGVVVEEDLPVLLHGKVLHAGLHIVLAGQAVEQGGLLQISFQKEEFVSDPHYPHLPAQHGEPVLVTQGDGQLVLRDQGRHLVSWYLLLPSSALAPAPSLISCNTSDNISLVLLDTKDIPPNITKWLILRI